MVAQTAAAADAASDPQIDPRVRTFLAEHSSPFFWDLLPATQVRAISTGLQAKTPADLSGGTIAEETITVHGRNIEPLRCEAGKRRTVYFADLVPSGTLPSPLPGVKPGGSSAGFM